MLKLNYIPYTVKVQILILLLALTLFYFISTVTSSSVIMPILKTTPVVDTTFTIIHPTN